MTDAEKILIETEQRCKSNEHRLDEIDGKIINIEKENKAIYKIATSVEVIAQKIGTIEDKVDETKKKVDETADAQRNSEDKFLKRISDIENAPARKAANRADKIKTTVYASIMTFLATSFIGYLFMHLGLLEK